MNSTPYGHWYAAHYNALAANSSLRYHAAIINDRYHVYTGDVNSAVALQTNSSYGNTTGSGVFGWRAVGDAATYLPLCEMPTSVYTCPQSPPEASLPIPGEFCRWPALRIMSCVHLC